MSWGEKVRCVSISPNKFNKFNNTGSQMQDSIYHIAFESHLICDFCIKTSSSRH